MAKRKAIIELMLGCVGAVAILGTWAIAYVGVTRLALWGWSAIEVIFSLGFIMIVLGILTGALILDAYHKLKKA